ncbi:MAG: hypothetical protein IKS54_02185 [Erysipelotrichaceae bacterium]|nr:hypothetical protein [Erysipelotrichaceae bacterium]
MNKTLCKQLSKDYCCEEKDVLDEKNHFFIHSYLEGRRRYREQEECFLKIVSVNSKLLFCGKKQIIDICKEKYHDYPGEWFFEAENLRKLNQILSEFHYHIEAVRPFFIGEQMSDVDTGDYDVKWYTQEEIFQFKGDPRFKEAFTFVKDAPDVIGVSLSRDGEILTMAGASADSPYMWQVGIDTLEKARGKGLGSIAVALIKNEILKKGILPFYGTSLSHIISQKTALNAGFVPAWAELNCTKDD